MKQFGLPFQFPVPVNTMIRFISYLYQQGYAASTVFSMISAISFVHSLSQHQDPAEHPLVKRTLQGVVPFMIR
jgi:hypothetical protein